MSRLASFALVVTLFALAAQAQDVPVRTLLLSDADPGTGDGATFDRFSEASINEAGEVVFLGFLEGPGVTSANDRGLWLVTRTGTLVLLAREGDPAPGTVVSGAVFSAFTTPVTLNDSGVAAFRAVVSGPGVNAGNNEAIYTASAADGLRPVVVEGGPAPGLPGVLISDPNNISGAFNVPVLNDAGEIAFTARLFGPGVTLANNGSVYLGPPDAPVLLLREQEPLPASGIPGATLTGYSQTPELLDDGTLATELRAFDDGRLSDLLAAVRRPGTVRALVRDGESAPGGGPYAGFNSFSVTEQGDLAFRTQINETSTIIAGRPGDLRAVAAEDGPVPDFPGLSYLGVGGLRLGFDGEVAYTAFVTPSNLFTNMAVFATVGGVPTTIALEGQPAPGGGVYISPDDPVIGNGVVVFESETQTNDEVLYVWTPEDGVRRFIGLGSSVEVAPGDTRSVFDLRLVTSGGGFGISEGAGGPGEPHSFNARNELAFTAEFTDGSAGVFSAALSPRSEITLTAQATSPLAVAPGGAVSFAYTVTNATGNAVSGDLFFTAARGGAVVAQGRVRSGTLAPGQSRSGSYTQQVPQGAPAGSYAYALQIGTFPSAAADEETFVVTVTGPAAPAGRAAAWAVTGATPWEPEAATRLAGGAAGEVEAFPNPFASAATLRFGLAEAGAVRLAVYDVLGREVAVLAEGRAEAGEHEVSFDGRGLPSGVYVWRLETERAPKTGRLTLVR